MLKGTKIILVTMALAAAFFMSAALAQAATYYVDSASGNDANNGTSTSSPWKTLPKVSGKTFAAGDTILFKRGSVWRGELKPRNSGAAGKPITYGAYGSGAKPEFWGVENFNQTGDWTHTGSNRWKTQNNIIGANIAFMLVGGRADSNIKKRKSALTELTKAGDFYWDSANKCAYVYSTVNPANAWSVLEIPVYNDGVFFENKSYINVQDITARYYGVEGFKFRNVSYVNVVRCEAHVGGGRWTDTQRYGNAFSFYNGARNSSFRDCVATQWWDWGFVVEHWGNNATSRDTVIDNCKVETSGGGIEVAFMKQVTSGLIEDITVTNNLCTDLGYGWAGYTDNLKGSGLESLSFSSTACTLRNVTMTDNVVDRYTNYGADLRGTQNIQFLRNQLKNGTGLYGYTDHKGGIECYGRTGGELWLTGVIAYNLIQNQDRKAGIFIFNNQPPSGTLKVANNTIVNSGVANDKGRAGIIFSGATKYEVKNNLVFSKANSYAISWSASSGASVANNLYWTATTTAPLVYYGGATYTRSNFTNYKAETGAVCKDPLLEADSSLKSASPAVDDGLNVIGVHDTQGVLDLLGNAIVGSPDLGACEYTSAGLLPPTELNAQAI